MVNKNKNRMNQPPTGEGKKQSTNLGSPGKIDKRSEVLQASQRRENIGTAEDESETSARRNPKRPKSGR